MTCVPNWRWASYQNAATDRYVIYRQFVLLRRHGEETSMVDEYPDAVLRRMKVRHLFSVEKGAATTRQVFKITWAI